MDAVLVAFDNDDSVTDDVTDQEAEISVTALVALDVPCLCEAGKAGDDLVDLEGRETVQGADGAEGVVGCDLDGLGHSARPVLLLLGQALAWRPGDEQVDCKRLTAGKRLRVARPQISGLRTKARLSCSHVSARVCSTTYSPNKWISGAGDCRATRRPPCSVPNRWPW